VKGGINTNPLGPVPPFQQSRVERGLACYFVKHLARICSKGHVLNFGLVSTLNLTIQGLGLGKTRINVHLDHVPEDRLQWF
jgi:hypothetical protein